jgi:hypothetical protein
VEQTATRAVATADRLIDLMRRDTARVAELAPSAGAAARVFTALCERPVASIGTAARVGISVPSVGRGMDALVSLGIASEITGRRRNRVYAYDAYLSILTQEPAKP